VANQPTQRLADHQHDSGETMAIRITLA